MTIEQDKNKREGYSDATCNRSSQENRDSYYYEGYMLGQLTKIEWTMQDLKFAMVGDANDR